MNPEPAISSGSGFVLPMPNSANDILQLSDVRKSYGSVEVLHGISLTLKAGEILGLVGENGAGKSTMMKCLNGIEKHSAGKIIYNGSELNGVTPSAAIKEGIITIPQEFNLVNDLCIYENIFLGQELKNRFGLLDIRSMQSKSRELLKELNSNLDVNTPVSELSVAAKQMVEIAKAMAYSCRLLIMDEPTTVLNKTEVSALFAIVRKLQSKGTSVIFISHKLREILELCDKVAVLRDGELVSFSGMEGLDEAELARRMVGRPPSQMFSEKSVTPQDAKTALQVQNLSVEELLHDISFELKCGEILGFAGLVGAGRTELAEAIYGIRKRSGGTIHAFGKEINPKSPRQALNEGIAYLPEDRQGTGIMTSFTLAANVTLASLENYCKPFISTKAENASALKYIERFHIKSNGVDTVLSDLSGGNQQKVAIAKGLDTSPKIFIFDEPTRGIDIQAKSEVYEFMDSLLKQGMACMLISSDMEEITGMCNRVAVMREGRIAGFLKDEQITEENIMYLASGVSAK